MMERQQSVKEKSVAWFKLADLIARGEREKALSVFRLMAHSLSDRAYALQLEGDILWHLESGNASEKYKQAAFLYQKEKRWIDAIAIYEHLLTQDPDSYEILATLLVFYATVDWREKFEDRYQCLLQLFYNRVVDELQIENAVKDLVIAVQMFEEEAQKTWFLQWFTKAVNELPEVVAVRLRGLL